jgi:CDP-glucose 4,6-dehydratase
MNRSAQHDDELGPGVWRARSVLLTGHTGFKGGWLAAWLNRLGARVHGYALPPETEPNLFSVARLADECAASTFGDVRDAAALQTAFDRAAPDVVFHLAAQPLVRRSYAEPQTTFATNVLGTANVLEAVRRHGRPCAVVVVTSDKVYAVDRQDRAYAESDRLGGHDPYSASKAAAELVVDSYRSSYFPSQRLAEHGIAVATVRAGNVIGGGDWAADRIVVDAVRSFTRGEPLRLRNPASVRPWQHVLDPLAGYLTLAAKMLVDPQPQWCAAWNFGPTPGTDVSVDRLARQLAEYWPGAEIIDAHDPQQPVETHVLRIAIDKALAALPWRSVWNVGEAVERTARWYRRFQASPHESMLSACHDDLDAYLARRSSLIEEVCP